MTAAIVNISGTISGTVTDLGGNTRNIDCTLESDISTLTWRSGENSRVVDNSYFNWYYPLANLFAGLGLSDEVDWKHSELDQRPIRDLDIQVNLIATLDDDTTFAISDGAVVGLTAANGGNIMTQSPIFHNDSAPSNVTVLTDLYTSISKAVLSCTPRGYRDPVPLESPIEVAFKEQRDAGKIAAISYIYANPDCVESEVVAAAQAVAPLINAAFLLNIYVAQSVEQGFLNEPTFAAFKAFVLSKTPEELMAI